MTERAESTETEDSEGDAAAREQLVRLLESLRVLLPGIQVLFAFLLTVPYTGRFADQGTFQHAAVYVTLVFSAISIIFLLAPLVAYRQHYGDVTATTLRRWNVLVIIGYFFLGLALVGALVTLTELIWDDLWSVLVAGAITTVLLITLWIALPRRDGGGSA